MALSPIFTIKPSCNYDQLIVQETTGAYNATTNPGGYGAPNATTGDVSAISLVITDLLNDIVFDAITTLTASSTHGVTYIDISSLLVSTVAQYTDALTDGLFQAVFSVTASGTTYTYTATILFLPDTWCKLNNLMLQITDPTCGCVNKDFKDKWLEGFAKLVALEGSAVCGDLTGFNTTYTSLNRFLDNLKCNC